MTPTDFSYSFFFKDYTNQEGIQSTKQSDFDSCAIKAQQIILANFNIYVSEEQLAFEARQMGWYERGKGSPLAVVGKLLLLHGLQVHVAVNGTIQALINDLARGREVIVAVNADELWNGAGSGSANHVLVVAGIDTSDPTNVMVIIKDPGSGDVGKAYTLDKFIAAWKPSRFFMVSTEQPKPWMAHFDYNAGHISDIAGLSYRDWLEENEADLNDMQWPNSNILISKYIDHLSQGRVSEVDEENTDVSQIEQDGLVGDDDYDHDFSFDEN